MRILFSIGIIIAFILVMISPCIQLALSASKKRFVWMIMPIVTLIFMSAVAFISSWHIIIKILFSICVPIILLIFHYFVKKNLFH